MRKIFSLNFTSFFQPTVWNEMRQSLYSVVKPGTLAFVSSTQQLMVFTRNG